MVRRWQPLGQAGSGDSHAGCDLDVPAAEGSARGLIYQVLDETGRSQV